MRLGIFGGTFDPVHLGHLIVAETARAQARLERVLFVLSHRPPHKNAVELAPVLHRLDMLNLALAGHPNFFVSTIELQREGVSYTVDTLRRLQSLPEYRAAELHLIIGSDSLAAFEQWREPEAIMQLARLLVYPRLETSAPAAYAEFQKNSHLLEAPIVEISSTEIRRRLQQSESIRYLVPDAVLRYIEANRLYC